jgi:hypothetical protein
MSSDPEDYKRAFWSRRQMQKFSKAGSGVFQGCHAVPLQTEEAEPKKQNPSTKERSSTVLRFASFPRSIVRDSGRLSRVEMNALRAPLTASQNLKMTCANFPLDGADDFIDERNGDLYEAAGAADATACSKISSDGGMERLISWATEKGGPRDPTTQKDAGRDPAS